jgi:hypothetical protein
MPSCSSLYFFYIPTTLVLSLTFDRGHSRSVARIQPDRWFFLFVPLVRSVTAHTRLSSLGVFYYKECFVSNFSIFYVIDEA